jgi:hypothetical protein
VSCAHERSRAVAYSRESSLSHLVQGLCRHDKLCWHGRLVELVKYLCLGEISSSACCRVEMAVPASAVAFHNCPTLDTLDDLCSDGAHFRCKQPRVLRIVYLLDCYVRYLTTWRDTDGDVSLSNQRISALHVSTRLVGQRQRSSLQIYILWHYPLAVPLIYYAQSWRRLPHPKTIASACTRTVSGKPMR